MMIVLPQGLNVIYLKLHITCSEIYFCVREMSFIEIKLTGMKCECFVVEYIKRFFSKTILFSRWFSMVQNNNNNYNNKFVYL